MKKIISALFALAGLLATPAFAGTIDLEYDHTKGCEMYSAYLDQTLVGKTGLFAYAATTSTDWSEAYGGLSYATSPNLCLSFGAGGQSGTNETRFGGSIWTGKEKASLLWLWEQGGGKWNKLVLKYQATPKIAVGYVEKTCAGKGLYAEITLSQGTRIKFHGFSEPQIGFVKSFAF